MAGRRPHLGPSTESHYFSTTALVSNNCRTIVALRESPVTRRLAVDVLHGVMMDSVIPCFPSPRSYSHSSALAGSMPRWSFSLRV